LPENLFNNVERMLDEDPYKEHRERQKNLPPDEPRDVMMPVRKNQRVKHNNIQTINLSINKITDLPEKLFNSMGNLQGINLSDNKIVNLNENLFNHLKTCRSIYLCNNRIEKLEKNVFKNLEKIEIIDLYNNKISDLSEADLFKDLKELNCINLAKNGIRNLFKLNDSRTLDNFFFKNFTNLKSIDLSENKIDSLHNNLFDSMVEIEEIDLSQNQIADLPKDIFKKLTNLKNIDLSNNKIANFYTNLFDTMVEIETIDLSQNQIADLPKDIFKKLTNLQNIDLSNNQINILSDSLLENLNLLDKIDLSQNLIEQLPENFFKNSMFNKKDDKNKEEKESILRFINLSNNKIVTLHDSLLKNLNSLEAIDLSNNKISEFPTELFKNLVLKKDVDKNKEEEKSILTEIDLSRNKIIKMEKKMFDSLVNLEDINLSNNQISDLPIDLFSNLPGLKGMTFANNQIGELPKDLFSNLPELKYIDFSKNKIKEFSPSFLASCADLKYINFSNNLIERLPLFEKDCDFIIDFQGNFPREITYLFQKILDMYPEYYDDLLSKKYKYFKNKDQDQKQDKKYLCRNLFEVNLNENFFLFFLDRKDIDLKKAENSSPYGIFLESIEKFKKFEWFVLDFLIYMEDSVDDVTLLALRDYIKNLKNEYPFIVNLEFKIKSPESLEYLCKRKKNHLFKSFLFKDDQVKTEYIDDPKQFFPNIDFKKCFENIFDTKEDTNQELQNTNEEANGERIKTIEEELIINMLKIFYTSVDNYCLDTTFIEGPLKEFNKLFLKDYLPKFFENKWFDVIENVLDIFGNLNFFSFLDSDHLKEVEKKDTKSETKKNQVSHNDKTDKDSKKEDEDIEVNEDHVLLRITNTKNNTFLKHKTTVELLNKKWNLIPRFVYYLNLIFLLTFLVFYSINIEVYKNSNSSSLNKACKGICITLLVYFIVLEMAQMLIMLFSYKILIYLSLSKNVFEILTFFVSFIALLIDLFTVNIEVKTSFYSITIILCYFVFIMRLDKFSGIGPYINVFGNIIKRSLRLVIIMLISIVGFLLSFRNRSTYYVGTSAELTFILLKV
jgi:Leucine-rich repeat (LRR) protein